MKSAICVLCFFCVHSVFAFAPLDTRGFRKLDCRVVPLSRNSQEYSYIHHHRHHQATPAKHIRSGTCSNWCGYVAAINMLFPLKKSVTNVFGTWEVPTISKSSKHTHCGIWVGMDGYDDDTTVQIGTEHGRCKGRLVNYAWFEIFPGLTYQIKGFPVKKGDRVGGQVEYVGTSSGKDIFQLTIFNYTKMVWWIAPEAFSRSAHAKRNSAEWIVEAPSSTKTGAILPLAHFSPITFQFCQVTMQDITGAISNSSWQNESLKMVSSSKITKAKPSSLSSDGSSFTVRWKHE